ncbi:hypothetical protein BALOs_0807 [Halobacteriovorax sp. BALOs_7]|uniref:glycosyltransferase family 4 protein n=1 Tax=Halobacteriovorax sp. BALOs_7 TaxID=2109558 RepID=UPI000EA29021|nr:glycosyltransferase family 4 protein [Halobacteriovorax sp. BALOs_7]AYF43817.1 hypothetical protein BALOs_0807 [Halobacteriovorax sp. BALOs_7]
MNKDIRVMQIIKTTEGASWALHQVKFLVRCGIDVHVILNNNTGKFYNKWKESGATIYTLESILNPLHPFKTLKSILSLRRLIKEVNPDIIHSHFFINTIHMRMASFRLKPTRIFQVPGPLHLEHAIFKYIDLFSARKNDRWIASSKHIKSLYIKSGINEERVDLSYYGNDYSQFNSSDSDHLKRDHHLRNKYGFKDSDIVIGNVCYIYPPKKFLGQKVGLKNHEVMIKAIEIARQQEPRIKGLFIGGQWGDSTSYEQLLRRSIPVDERENIVITGKIPPSEAAKGWQNLDYAIHLPLSESCGGVIEPLLAQRPVISCKTGGIPEIIIEGYTGFITSRDNPQEVASKILEVIKNKKNAIEYTLNGKNLVLDMFNIERTAKEILEIYKKIMSIQNSYEEYSSKKYLKRVNP